MLHPDFKNGQKIDLQSAMALFVLMMGMLFFVDSTPGTHMLLSTLTILVGIVWFAGHTALKHWNLKHHH